MQTPFTLQFVITQTQGQQTLRDFLLEHHISRTALTDIKYHGGFLYVNGKEENVRYLLNTGDTVTVQFPPEALNQHIKPEPISLTIVYEDDALLVVEKPAGMSTIPSREHPNGTLANAVMYHYIQSGHHAAIHFVTRLDYDTSGLVLIAKHRHIHHLLSLAQQENAITKEYLAFIPGSITPPQGRIDEPIGRVNESIIQREVRPDGQPATTLYGTEQILTFEDDSYSILRLQLITGRTHQIRVHLQYLGHPLLGDSLYGGDCTRIQRQALHCARLQFAHPITGEPLQFDSALPKDMVQLLLNPA